MVQDEPEVEPCSIVGDKDVSVLPNVALVGLVPCNWVEVLREEFIDKGSTPHEPEDKLLCTVLTLEDHVNVRSENPCLTLLICPPWLLCILVSLC